MASARSIIRKGGVHDDEIVNADGRTDSADAALLLQYLLTKTKTLPSPDNADLDGNGILNAADLSALKRLTA